MNKFTLYTYDLLAGQSNCNDCHSPRVDEKGCIECKSKDVYTQYDVNDIYVGETIEADSFEDAFIKLELKMDLIEIDNSGSDETVYFNYKGNYKPACEVRKNLK